MVWGFGCNISIGGASFWAVFLVSVGSGPWVLKHSVYWSNSRGNKRITMAVLLVALEVV